LPPAVSDISRVRYPRKRPTRGFTLVEAAVTIVVVGVGMVAMMEFVAGGTAVNRQAADLTTAVQLAREVRELSAAEPFADLPALDGVEYDPPVDAAGGQIESLPGWSQQVAVAAVDPAEVRSAPPDLAAVVARRVTVVVSRGDEQVHTATWLRFGPAE